MENLSLSFVSLLIYLLVLTPLMLLGFYFARRKMFNPHHKFTMTLVLIGNWILIFMVMSPSIRQLFASNPNYSEIPTILPVIHMAIGTIAQLLGTYLVLLMWTEKTPLEKLVFFRIKNIKTPMRITLALWLTTILLGFGIYAVWYGGSNGDTGNTDIPAVTEEAPDADATEEAEADATDEAPEPDATEEN